MSEKEREQNEKSLHEYLNRKAEEQFFRMAAEEIDAEEDRLFAQAQELPDPTTKRWRGWKRGCKRR